MTATWRIVEGFCVEAMAAMQSSSVDAVVCDPPYGLEFMGKAWDAFRMDDTGTARHRGDAAGDHGAREGGTYGGDGRAKAKVSYGGGQRPTTARCVGCGKRDQRRNPHDCPEGTRWATEIIDPYAAPPTMLAYQEWCRTWAREALRVLRPGGHLLAFGGTRTYHRLACAVEDAGFEIRDEVLRGHTIDLNDRWELLATWREWSERVPSAGLTFREPGGSSAGGRVRLATSRAESPAAALIAELALSARHLTPEDSSSSAPSPATAPTTALSAHVTIAARSSASPDPTSSPGSTAPSDAPEWLAASQEAITRAAAALTIWLGAEPYLRPAATDALCAALTSALKHITCAHSETFRSYDTTWQTVCVSATTATTTESTAASLISFMADTLAAHDLGGDALGSPPLGPLAWYYGSGFPSLKSLDVSKAIDKAAGAEREVIGRKADPRYASPAGESSGVPMGSLDSRVNGAELYEAAGNITAPATPAAERWQGWGTALKPAHEPIVMARKPLVGTVAGNVLAHGTGALNVDGCRIEGTGPGSRTSAGGGEYQQRANSFNSIATNEHPAGRWPANVLLDERAAAMLDEQTGELKSPAPYVQQTRERGEVYGLGSLNDKEGKLSTHHGDSGGASRFLYVAKASSAERNAGLGIQRNVHPTVKPIELMRWLVRLVTPLGGTVLDPFTGSGTTGIAAILEGFDFIGIEREAEYADIAEARIRWWEAQPAGIDVDDALAGNAARAKVADAGQLDMFGMAQIEPEPQSSGSRDGEASAERRYIDRGSSNFAMKPGRRRP